MPGAHLRRLTVLAMRELPLPYVPIDPRIETSDRIRALRVALDAPPSAPVHVGVILLLLYAGAHHPDGNLGAATALELSEWAGWTGDPDAYRAALMASGWIVERDGCTWIEGWERHGGKVLAIRVRWRRNRSAARRSVLKMSARTPRGQVEDTTRTGGGQVEDPARTDRGRIEMSGAEPEPEPEPDLKETTTLSADADLSGNGPAPNSQRLGEHLIVSYGPAHGGKELDIPAYPRSHSQWAADRRVFRSKRLAATGQLADSAFEPKAEASPNPEPRPRPEPVARSATSTGISEESSLSAQDVAPRHAEEQKLPAHQDCPQNGTTSLQLRQEAIQDPASLRKSSAKKLLTESAQQVFDRWRTVMQRNGQTAFDARRRSKVEARLRDGYTVQDLCLAIDGCALTPHNRGQNDTGQRYDDLALICRDAEHVDRFIRNARSPPVVQSGRVVDTPWRI